MKGLLNVVRYLCFSLVLCGLSQLYAQDQLFLLDNTKFTCRVLEVGKKIKYQSLSGQDENSIPTKLVAWISYVNGNLLVFNDKDQKMIPFDHDYYDKILMRNSEVIPVEIKGFDENNISFINLKSQQLGEITVPKSEVLAVFYRNKQLIQYNSTTTIAQALFRAVQPYDVPRLEENNTVEEIAYTSPLSDTQEPSNTNRPIESAKEEIRIDNMEQPLEEDITTTENEVTQEAFMKVSQEEFAKKALDKTRRLTQYIRVITDKTIDKYQSNKAINEAIILFMSDTCVVQVSNVNQPEQITEYYIRPYLDRIKLLKYDKVEIEWADINYVGEVRKGPDGNYFGYVTFVQTFRGFKDGNIVYEDKTEKRIEVILKSYEFEIDGATKELWDVLLSNIKVEQTTRL